MGLIVALVLGAHGINLRIFADGRHDAEIVNTSGQQRMLSQRIPLLSRRYVETGSRVYRDLLGDSLDTFEANHKKVVTKARKRGAALLSHYLGPDGAGLDQNSREFAALSRRMTEAAPGSADTAALYARLEEMALVDLLRGFDTAVKIFEAEAGARNVILERVPIIVVAATLIVNGGSAPHLRHSA